MITVVDRNNGLVVQKVTKPNGALVRYQVKPDGIFDADQVKVHVTLESARAAIGKNAGGKAIAVTA